MPRSWGTLHALCGFPDAVLEMMIADGTIHSEIERPEVEEMLQKYQGVRYRGHPGLGERARLETGLSQSQETQAAQRGRKAGHPDRQHLGGPDPVHDGIARHKHASSQVLHPQACADQGELGGLGRLGRPLRRQRTDRGASGCFGQTRKEDATEEVDDAGTVRGIGTGSSGVGTGSVSR